MRTVNQFEGDLLRILQAVLSRAPMDPVHGRLFRGWPRPTGLSRDAIEMIENSLATGIVMRVVRSGCWQRGRFLRNGSIVEGSLWERTPPNGLGISFSASSLDLLMHLTAAAGPDSIDPWIPDVSGEARPFTVGDRVLQYFIACAMFDRPWLSDWCRHEPFRSNRLIALAMPDQFAVAESDPEFCFDSWMNGSKAIYLEALQTEFVGWLVRMVHAKSGITDAQQVQVIGSCEDRVLDEYISAAKRHRRPDLCRFILLAAKQLLSASTTIRDWLPLLETGDLKFRQRVVTYQAGASLLRAVQKLAKWQRQIRSIGYFDEGYTESQWLKACWEHFDGEQLNRHAKRMLVELDG